MTYAVEFQNVSRLYGDVRAVDGVSIGIRDGEFFSMLGPSGSGKTTCLRLIAGFEQLSGGTIHIFGQPASELPPWQRDVNTVFQDYALFPHMSILDNVAYGLMVKGMAKKARHARAQEALEKVALGFAHHRKPSQLSGGQRQRVAIARALASNPKVLLCDEATSALDPATTRSILELLKDINRRLGLTILLITHEMDVVKRICDCVAVISNGQLIEQDTVSEVFSHPKTPLAQQFIQSTLHLDIPDDYQARLKPTATADSVPMLRMEFTGHSVDAPLLSETARRFNVNNNIISAQMDYAGGVKFGIMLTEMHGTQEDTQAAIAWLQEHHVKVEVLGYV